MQCSGAYHHVFLRLICIVPSFSQILPEQGSKQLQLDCKDADNRVQLKHESRGGGRRVFRCLFGSDPNLRYLGLGIQ